jgi:hypothetical protein
VTEASDATPIPHAFGRFPLNIGAGTLPFIWGLVHGVSTGVWVQVVGAFLWLGGIIARKQSAPVLVILGWALAGLCIALNLWFAFVADRLAWVAHPERDVGDYVKAQRTWAVLAPLWAVFVVMYRSDL